MILRGLDVDDLIILTMLLDNFQVTEIGHKLHLTQPAITQRLGKIRRCLGFSPTIKIGRYVRLTNNGLPVAIAAKESLKFLLSALPDTLSDWRSDVLVHYILGKCGDRTADESYNA